MTEGTLRRAIRAGTVTAEQRRRNPDSPADQRMVYEVLITDPLDGASDSETDHPPTQLPASATEPPEVSTRVLDVLAEACDVVEYDHEVIRAREGSSIASP